jgi:hypothetical protein
MARLAEHFHLPLASEALREIVAGPAFTRHSKFDGAFAAAEREAEHRTAEQLHGDEIDKVLHWAEVVARTAGVELSPPGALMEGVLA